MASHSKVKDCIALLMVFGTLASVTHVTSGYFVRDAYAKILEVKDVANHSERKVEYLSTSSSEDYFDFKYVDSGGMTRSTGNNHTEVSYDSNSTRLSGHCGGNPVNEASSSDVSELKQMMAQNTELFRDYNINKGPQINTYTLTATVNGKVYSTEWQPITQGSEGLTKIKAEIVKIACP